MLIIMTSCGGSDQSGVSSALKKKSNGAYGEIVLVVDSTKWKGEVGEALKDLFLEPYPGLPQAEAMFMVRYVPPEKFETLLQLASNIVMVTSFDANNPSDDYIQQYFSDSSIQMVRQDPSIYRFVRKDEFARDQVLLFLFGPDETTLVKNIRTNTETLREFLNQRERKRVFRELFSGKTEKAEANLLKEKYGFEMLVPFGYDLAIDKEGFVWLSQPGVDVFRNLVVAWKPYKSEDQFSKDSIVAWRDGLGRKHLFGSGEKDTSSYMVTDQRYLPAMSRQVSFRGQYATEVRGLWKLKNRLRGGPFLSYVFNDPKSGRLYYLEGFVYAPNKMKRSMMRELEATLFSFRP